MRTRYSYCIIRTFKQTRTVNFPVRSPDLLGICKMFYRPAVDFPMKISSVHDLTRGNIRLSLVVKISEESFKQIEKQCKYTTFAQSRREIDKSFAKFFTKCYKYT